MNATHHGFLALFLVSLISIVMLLSFGVNARYTVTTYPEAQVEYALVPSALSLRGAVAP